MTSAANAENLASGLGQRRDQENQVDRILSAWPTVCRVAKDDWTKSFATSIAKQAKNPHWQPSPKQLALMSSMVAQLYQRRAIEDGDDFDVIEQ